MIVGLGDLAAEDYGPPLSAAPDSVQKEQAALAKKNRTKLAATTRPKSKATSSTSTKALAAGAAADAPKGPAGRVMGLPKQTAWLVAGLAAAGLAAAYFSRKKGRKTRNERVVKNPRPSLRHRDPDVQKAVRFREEFHWGYPAKKITRRQVSPSPKVLVELGKVHSITYRTRKKGESASLFEHEFESRQPVLAMDVKNKRLHIVGGSYTVTADGITG